MGQDVITLDKKMLAIGATILALLAILIISQGDDGKIPLAGSNVETILENKGFLIENSTNISISAFTDVTGGIVSFEVNETFLGPDETPLVRTSYVYLDTNTSEAFILAYHITPEDAHEGQRKLLVEEFDISLMNYSMEGYIPPE